MRFTLFLVAIKKRKRRQNKRDFYLFTKLFLHKVKERYLYLEVSINIRYFALLLIEYTNIDIKIYYSIDLYSKFLHLTLLNENYMNSKQRIQLFIKAKGLNNNKFEEKAGLSSGFLSNLKNNLPTSTLNLIGRAFPELNMDWVITGTGQMLKAEEPGNFLNREATLLPSEQIIYIPLVNQYAYAGYICNYDDSDYIKSLPTVPFIMDYEGNGNYIAFEVKGDSMNDGSKIGYQEGDRLFCREIPSRLWSVYQLNTRKRDFVIVHERGVFIRRILNHDVAKKTITLHPLNEFYPDKTIDLTEVKQIFTVIESIRSRRRR